MVRNNNINNNNNNNININNNNININNNNNNNNNNNSNNSSTTISSTNQPPSLPVTVITTQDDQDIPVQVILEILGYLSSIKDLINLSRSSKSFYQLINTREEIWKRLSWNLLRNKSPTSSLSHQVTQTHSHI